MPFCFLVQNFADIGQGRMKMREMKLRDMKMRHQTAMQFGAAFSCLVISFLQGWKMRDIKMRDMIMEKG